MEGVFDVASGDAVIAPIVVVVISIMVDVPTSVNTDVVIPSIADVVISTIVDGPTSITADVVMVAIVDVFMQAMLVYSLLPLLL